MQFLYDEFQDLELMGYKDDLHDLTSKIDRVADRIDKIPAAPTVSKWTKASPLIAGGAFLFALFAFWSNHSAGDVKNVVTIEVTNQLKDPLAKIGTDSRSVRTERAI
jgi:hypothetical protein